MDKAKAPNFFTVECLWLLNRKMLLQIDEQAIVHMQHLISNQMAEFHVMGNQQYCDTLFSYFPQYNLTDTDWEILLLRMQGHTKQEIADKSGYKTASAVHKRIAHIANATRILSQRSVSNIWTYPKSKHAV